MVSKQQLLISFEAHPGCLSFWTLLPSVCSLQAAVCSVPRPWPGLCGPCDCLALHGPPLRGVGMQGSKVPVGPELTDCLVLLGPARKAGLVPRVCVPCWLPTAEQGVRPAHSHINVPSVTGWARRKQSWPVPKTTLPARTVLPEVCLDPRAHLSCVAL